MSNIILFDHERITVEYMTDKKIVHHTIHAPVGGQILRDALESGTAALAKYGASKWLSDDRKNGPLDEAEREWGFVDWNRRTMEAGWKYWANVVPQAVVDAGTLGPTIEDLFTLGLRVMVFTDLEEATAWLDSFPN
ncbi:MAG: hypothetical protein GXY36_08005 [Chloroflexi bacterium]|nr:hypothetical protein [Chloroflexota bacterium]